jgi:crotonobetainyl-CoA:carnitine CoA-transferase CaiB-like acyl-CoA transferase
VSTAGVFSGVRIVELAYYVFVPGAAALFADQGAEVIKVESIGTGDLLRTLNLGDGRGSVNAPMEQNNRGKMSIALDLKSPAGRQAFLDLIKTADIFLSGLRSKALKSLRLDVDDLRAVNPKIIYARGNGFGFRGAEADKPGFDATAFYARGGVAHVVTRPGQEMVPARAAMGDHLGSMNLAYGMASALFHREKTGEPSVVETSLLATAAWMLSGDITLSQLPGYVVHHPVVNRFPLIRPYTTRDGRMILLNLLEPEAHWPHFCKMLEIEELVSNPRFKDIAARQEHAEELIAIIGERIGRRDWVEWKPIFEAWDAPWELVQTVQEIFDDPQVIANEIAFDVPTQNGSPFKLVAGPVAFDGHPLAGKPRAAPYLGEHTNHLLHGIGYSDATIAQLKEKRVAR